MTFSSRRYEHRKKTAALQALHHPMLPKVLAGPLELAKHPALGLDICHWRSYALGSPIGRGAEIYISIFIHTSLRRISLILQRPGGCGRCWRCANEVVETELLNMK